MVKGTLLIVILVLQNVHSFQFKQSPSIKFPLRLNPEKNSIQSSLPTKSAIGVMKHSFQKYSESSLEKKLVIVAYPLTVLLIYVIFTSTFVVTSFYNFFQSLQKSLRETRAETLIQKNIEVDAKRWNIVHNSQLVVQIALAKAKKDIEAKLSYIVQDEMKAKF